MYRFSIKINIRRKLNALSIWVYSYIEASVAVAQRCNSLFMFGLLLQNFFLFSINDGNIFMVVIVFFFHFNILFIKRKMCN